MSDEEIDYNGERGYKAGYSCPWMVIYPCGVRTKLEIAQVQDYEIGEWALASRKTFTYEYDARDYMIQLAREHGLDHSGPHYLDE